MFGSRTVSYFLLFAVGFTFMSIPFFTGLLRPTFDTPNPYALFYAALNLPVTLLLEGVISWCAKAVWDLPTVEQVDLMQFFVCLAFWSVLGGLIGLKKDLRGDQA
ncbi:MAG TPA: hypothetical protein VGR15_01045 [Bacteroidota bacterium]|jgi:hypothetical protein|nr:hypothetical protein [Bacteroidota bacterium]